MRVTGQSSVTSAGSSQSNNSRGSKSTSVSRKKEVKKSAASSLLKEIIRCRDCGEGIELLRYKRHCAQVHGESRPFKCDLCHFATRERYRLNTHLRTHRNDRPFDCDTCPKSYTSLGSLWNHKRENHGMQSMHPARVQIFDNDTGMTLDDIVTLDPKRDYLKCTYCDLYFCFRASVTRHIKAMHTFHQTFPCDQCDKRYATPAHLEVHKQSQHGSTSGVDLNSVSSTAFNADLSTSVVLAPTATSAKHFFDQISSGTLADNYDQPSTDYVEEVTQGSFQCCFCHGLLPSLDLLNIHVRDFHNEGNSRNADEVNVLSMDDVYSCDRCQMTFQSASELLIHGVSQHQEKTEEILPFVTENRLEFKLACSKKSKRGGKPRKQNGNDQEIQCVVCQQGFATYELLTRHLHVHKVNPNQCGICDEVLESAVALASHLQTHLKSKSGDLEIRPVVID